MPVRPPLSSVLLCSSVLDHPDSGLVLLCLNRLAWGGLDVAVVPDSCKGATHVFPCPSAAPAAHAQAGRPGSNEDGQQQPILPSQALSPPFTLPDHVELLSAPCHAPETNDSSKTADTRMSLHAWLAGRAPESVLAVSGPATPPALLSSLTPNALGASWRIDPKSSPSSMLPQCEQRSDPAQHSKQGWAPAAHPHSAQVLPGCTLGSQEMDPLAPVPSTMPCLSYLPQRIAHHQYFQHLSCTRVNCHAAQHPAPPQQDPADLAGMRTYAAGQGGVEQGQPPLLVVGYVMKASREQAMAKCTPQRANVEGTTPALHVASRGSVPMPPSATKSGAKKNTAGLLSLVPCSPADHAPAPSPAPALCPRLVFAPLDLGRPLDDQMPFHAILHKASDELEWSSTGKQGVRAPSFSKRMQGLRAWLACHPHVHVIDPFESTEKVIDRLQLCALTGQLNTLDLGQVAESSSVGRVPMNLSASSPKYCTLWSHDARAIDKDLKAAGLTPPLILKPSVACGLPESHGMALVTAPGGEVVEKALRAARMPLPAIAQQFSNHGGQVAKVYAAGDKVFYSVRPSIPDISDRDLGHHATQAAQVLPCSPSTLCGQQGFHVFDSLKSLPTASSQQAHSTQQAQQPHDNRSEEGLVFLDTLLREHEHALQAIAKHLRAAFGLTLFGFDIISVPVRSGGGEERRPTGMDGETNDRQGDYKQQLSNDLCGLGSVGVASQREEGCVCGYQLVVIDVNYFPSYSSPGAAAHVWQAMLNRILG